MDKDLSQEDKRWLLDKKDRVAEKAHNNHIRFIEHLNRATIDSGILAIRSALIINGGAAVAILAYVANLPANKAAIIIGSIIYFAWGVVAATAGTAFAYMSNFTQVTGECFKERVWEHPYLKTNKTSKYCSILMYLFQILSIFAGLASVILFIFGMFEVNNTISSLANEAK